TPTPTLPRKREREKRAADQATLTLYNPSPRTISCAGTSAALLAILCMGSFSLFLKSLLQAATLRTDAAENSFRHHDKL
ncbi:MAG TPA: hypothetical protein VD863_20045, partial [Bradyrhizobium sp.]|nr:hypothetical protein [Bradyrhizobium sp.]